MADKVFKGDSAILEANILSQDGVNPLSATQVSWVVRKPDGTTITGGPTNVPATQANVVVNDTSQTGTYASQITFTLNDGNKKSTVVNFEVFDPLEQADVSTTGSDAAVHRAWMKLEDLFDSQFGGPHVRDRTEAQFSPQKISLLLPDALYGINQTYQPTTNYDATTFPWDQHTPLAAQALLVESIYHLIRSYTEQPAPVGTGVTYFDRRDYLARWQSVLTLEETKLTTWLDLFKRDQLGYSSTATLLGGYAGTYARPPRYMRGRFPYIGYRW
jgi:hypothetical protein